MSLVSVEKEHVIRLDYMLILAGFWLDILLLIEVILK
jgi:hypothetical protein